MHPVREKSNIDSNLPVLYSAASFQTPNTGSSMRRAPVKNDMCFLLQKHLIVKSCEDGSHQSQTAFDCPS